MTPKDVGVLVNEHERHSHTGTWNGGDRSVIVAGILISDAILELAAQIEGFQTALIRPEEGHLE